VTAVGPEILDLPIPDLAALVQKGEIKAEEVARIAVARIEERSGGLGAFLHVDPDLAVHDARNLDMRRSRSLPLGPLAGVPIGLKDAICTRTMPTTAGSRILTRFQPGADADGDGSPRGYRAPYDAHVVEKLRAAGALLFTKCNMDEFAMGSSTENSAFFPAKNPWDPTRAPGGSSGGSAVAVAAAMTPGALGSDTGGSIRQPASLTGTVGVKPTYGRVSRYGLVAFASSLDQIGPFAADVRSAARLFRVIAGRDPRDSTSIDPREGQSASVDAIEDACGKDVRGLRIGVPDEYFGEGLDPVVGERVRAAIDGLAGLGCEIKSVRLPHTRYAVAAYYVIATAEASSNLARFDGVRYGLRVPSAQKDLASFYGATRAAGFGREVKRRIMLGTYVLSAGYYDAYYLRAQRARTLIRRDFDEAFREVDVIATPVSPTVAFRLGEKVDDPLSMYLADVFTLPASMAGVPALSVPCGMSPATAEAPALPIGLQLIAPSLEEARLFTVAHAWEQISPARGLRPPVATR
jgi:aspartyl-tRNA(Asn)/glutamyl-tRNA(Gln) amidotransferase subunit A